MRTILQIVILLELACFDTLNARIITSENDSMEFSVNNTFIITEEINKHHNREIKILSFEYPISQEDSVIVFEFYSSLKKINGEDDLYWFDPFEPLHKWQGITLTPEDIDNNIVYRVSGINLEESNLVAKSKAQILNLNLPKLSYLRIRKNDLNGIKLKVTSDVLEKLELINVNSEIDFNDFSCANLKYLDISNNKKIISILSDLDCPKLEYLDLSHCNINTEIANFNKYSKLKYLYLENSFIHGDFENFVLNNLFEFSIRNNQVYGKIPDLSNNQLNYLNLAKNKFTFASFEESYTDLKKINQLKIAPQDTIIPLSIKFELEHFGNVARIETKGQHDSYSWFVDGNIIPNASNNFLKVEEKFEYNCQISNEIVKDFVLNSQYVSYYSTKLFSPSNHEFIHLDNELIFQWHGHFRYFYYILEISTDIQFDNNSIVFQQGMRDNYYQLDDNFEILKPNTRYFWRVKGHLDKKWYNLSQIYEFITGDYIMPINRDSIELVKFYDNFDGKNWRFDNDEYESNWISNKPISDWYGVELTSIPFDENRFENRVTGIRLPNRKLKGELYNIDLSKLKTLDLSGNEIWNLSNLSGLIELTDLNLSNCNLEGRIDLSGLPNIKKANLSQNSFTSGIESIFSNKTILHFDLSYNNFHLELDEYEDNLNLDYLDLSHNKISGNFAKLNFLKGLEVLNMDNNLIQATIKEIELNNGIQDLNLSSNQIYGNINEFKFTNNLKRLRMNSNQITGDISFLSNTNLEELELRYNHLTGSLLYKYPSNLSILDVSHNQMSGLIPTFTKNRLYRLDISNNKFVFRDFHYLQIWQFNSFHIFSASPQDTVIKVNINSENNNTFLEVDIEAYLPVYQWYKNSNPLIQTSTNSLLIDDFDAEYYCVISDEAIDFMTLTSDTIKFNGSSVLENEINNHVRINSINDILKVEFLSPDIIGQEFRIYSMIGLLVGRGELKNSYNEINTSFLASGLYYLVLTTNKGDYRNKFLIKR